MLMIVEVYEPQRVTFPLRLVRLFPITRQKYKIFLNYTGFVCFLGRCTLLRSMPIVRSVPVPMWTNVRLLAAPTSCAPSKPLVFFACAHRGDFVM